MWGATDSAYLFSGLFAISIHAPRVGSDLLADVCGPKSCISIHAPRVGSDHRSQRMPLHQTISIHAPRVGSDGDNSDYIPYHLHFNPRSPCGERLQKMRAIQYIKNFNPRSPCGERLCRRRDIWRHRHFNPRSPCGERRPHAHTPGSVARNFNPRSPCGERQIIELLETKIILISIHAPRVGSDVINHRHQTSKI